MAITYSEAIDANGERRGRATEAAAKAAKSLELASLQTTHSITYLALNSSLFAIGFWSRLATSFSIQFLEREAEVGKLLADILNNRPTTSSLQKAQQGSARPKIGATREQPAMPADAGLLNAARKAADGADQIVARIDDAARGVAAASSHATRGLVNAGIDAAKEVANAGIYATKEVAVADSDAAKELFSSGSDDANEVVAAGSDAVVRPAAGGNGAGQTIVAVADDSERAIAAGDSAPEVVTLSDGDQEIELRAERLVINKQRRQTGEARVRKQIVTEVKSIDVSVSHEELVIERQAVRGDADVDDGEPIAEETIRIPLTEEQVDIAKETVVREEVEIGKRHVDDVEHINDAVRHEELVVVDVVDGATTS